MDGKNFVGRRSGTENIHLDTGSPKSRRRSKIFSRRIRRGPFHHFTTHFPMPVKQEMNCWSMSGNFIYRHHVEPRVKLYSLREESFPIPHKYIDVTRVIHTTLDVSKKSRIDGYWNIDGSRDLSDSWTGFPQFTLLDEKPPEGHMWSGRRLTKRQVTSRPDHLWPELWRGMSKNAKLKEKHNGQLKKNQSSTMQEDYEESISLTLRTRSSKKPLKMLEKLETPMAPTMPCKTCKKNKHGETRCKTNDFKSKFACILEASEST